jgi:NAD(P)-dependent dehydrogenase (short-subunit alcohol dehydrogenase family)
MRTVLITGTSSGFGLVTAVELATRGWHVFATMRNLDKAGALEEALEKAGVRDRVEIGQLDVTDPESVSRAVQSTLERIGGTLDAVVHNAGVAVGGAFEDISDADLRRVMETNFWGVLAVTRALLPAFRKQRSGRILIVSSESAFAGQPTNSIYCASKWAVEGWAEAVAFELSPFGIEIVLVEPGPYLTDIWDASPRISPQGSPYRSWVQFVFRAGDAHVASRGRDPVEVGRHIAKVLEKPRPSFRNPVGRPARVSHFMRGKIPSALWRKIAQRYLGIHRLGV